MTNSGDSLSIVDATRVALWTPEFTGKLTSTQGIALDFEMQCQCHSNWCWAAVAASVAQFYSSATAWKQCTIANEELHRNDCCERQCGAANVPFNVTNTLASPLNRLGNFAALKFRRLTRAEVVDQLEAGRPLLARTVWIGGSAHFAAIVGYKPAVDTLAVRDPFFGSSVYEFDRFCSAYTSNVGRWTHTFYTKPA